MTLSHELLGFTAGLAIATVTAPVGVSGAVFLLPVQLSVLNVPSPSVTPTNLLFNVIAAPRALFRYRKQGHLTGPLTRLLITGTLPGIVIVIGSTIHVYAAAGPRTFRLLAALVLLPIGIWLLRRHQPSANTAQLGSPAPHTITSLALCVGVIGGIYGIGGGSILGPILVGSGLSVATVAPAALASTFVTSIAGALTYALLALTATGNIAPNWPLGLACGLGGLAGGYLGARLQPRLPEIGLRRLLGSLTIGLALIYVIQALS